MNICATWKTAGAAALLFFAGACAHAQHTAADISDRYYKDSQTTSQCSTSRRPAFLCEGVLLHVTHHPSTQHAWDPTPQEQKQGWIAFSYLRSDSNFSTLPDIGHHGYIFYAMFSAPEWAMNPTYVCAYPTIQAPGANAPCPYGVSPQTRTPNGSAAAFEQMIAAMNPFGPPNELRAQAWGPDLGYKLPVEAFFYIVAPGGSSGLANAQEDQKDFFTTFSRFVPIIKVTLPAAAGKRAAFNYYDADQVETPSATASAPACNPYFQSGEWETPPGSNYPSLRLVPTACARAMPWSQVEAAFGEVEAKYGKGPQWKNAMGLRNQLACHRDLARNKPYWDIEPDRKIETFAATSKDACNPPLP